MKNLLIILPILLSGCSSTYYAKVGAGYKVSESDIKWNDGSATHPISARMEVGAENGPYSYGVTHRSQYFTGKPFNNNNEYQVTEIFVDYKFEF